MPTSWQDPEDHREEAALIEWMAEQRRSQRKAAKKARQAEKERKKAGKPAGKKVKGEHRKRGKHEK